MGADNKLCSYAHRCETYFRRKGDGNFSIDDGDPLRGDRRPFLRNCGFFIVTVVQLGTFCGMVKLCKVPEMKMG